MIRRLAISIRLSFASVPTKQLHVIVELAGFRLLTFRSDACTLLEVEDLVECTGRTVMEVWRAAGEAAQNRTFDLPNVSRFSANHPLRLISFSLPLPFPLYEVFLSFPLTNAGMNIEDQNAPQTRRRSTEHFPR